MRKSTRILESTYFGYLLPVLVEKYWGGPSKLVRQCLAVLYLLTYWREYPHT